MFDSSESFETVGANVSAFVKDAVNNTVTGFTVHKSAKGYKTAQALKSANLAKEGKVGV